MDPVLLIVISVLTGVFIGILAGILGVGGGIIVIPFCRLVLGLPPIMCTGTSLFTIIFTSLSGAVTRIRNKMCVVPLGIAIGLGGALTSPLGVYLSTIAPDWLIMAVLISFQLWSIWQMFAKAHELGKRERERERKAQAVTSEANVAANAGEDKATADADIPSDFDPSAGYQPSKRDLAIGVGIGLIGGLASGFVGLGGGFVIVPLSCAILGISLRQMSGTSLIAIMILAIPGSIEHLMLGNVAILSSIAIIVGAVPGSILGATLAKSIPERQTRIAFGIFLSVVAAMLTLNEFGIL